MNVYLVGMPGSGKTAVGRELSGLMGRTFVDLDAEVASAAGKTVEEIFAQDGEERFRELEREALRKASRDASAVVACGGGAVLDPENRRILRESGTVVWLNVPLQRLRQRVGPGSRPLVRTEQDLERLLADRGPVYRDVADRVVDATGPPDAVAAIIQRELP